MSVINKDNVTVSESTDPDVKNFVVNYEDGTQRVIDKGFFCQMEDEGDNQLSLQFIMANVSGKELSAIVIGCIQLADKLGLFDKKKENSVTDGKE